MNHYLAIDLGAESGRLILGSLQNDKLNLKEVHRFPNSMLCLQGKYYWNIGQLYNEIITGLEKCVTGENIMPDAIGIDTWGVDYGLLASDGTLLGLPYAYRDPRTKEAIEEFGKLLPKRDLYQLTGTLLAPYNTLFQLCAAQKYHPELIKAASDLLFMPDLIAYLLTGEKKTEFCFATTSQLYNPVKRSWEGKLFQLLNIPEKIMRPIVNPAATIGYLSENICRETGMKKIPVVAVATHDTNSAVAAIPASGNNWAFISSGTWSIMGFESDIPVINDHSFSMNFTNEGGIENTFDVMKNHMGLWLIQECRRNWKNFNYEYGQMIEMAVKAKSFSAFIDVDDIRFLNPGNMEELIISFLKETGQPIPEDHGQFIRIILESLALKYRETLDQINFLKGSPVDTIYMTGGGIYNQVLCQFTANAAGITIKTGLAEGTAAGNIMTQALALGQVRSLNEIRQIIANSVETKDFIPEQKADWTAAYEAYCKNIMTSNEKYIQTN